MVHGYRTLSKLADILFHWTLDLLLYIETTRRITSIPLSAARYNHCTKLVTYTVHVESERAWRDVCGVQPRTRLVHDTYTRKWKEAQGRSPCITRLTAMQELI